MLSSLDASKRCVHILNLAEAYRKRSSHEQGMTKWRDIAARVTNRIGKQCRERWDNHLDPALSKSPWSEEEDLRLIEAQVQF